MGKQFRLWQRDDFARRQSLFHYPVTTYKSEADVHQLISTMCLPVPGIYFSILSGRLEPYPQLSFSR